MSPVVEQAQYLGFHIAGEEYAVDILGVREIIEYDTVTSVPRTPPHIRGVINLRGSVAPVVDLAVKFGLPATPVTKRTCIVVVEVDLDGKPTIMGVLVDSVSQVIDLAPGDIAAPPSFGTQVHVDYLRGMGQSDGKKFVLILDIDRVLSAEEILAASEVVAAQGAPPARDGPSPDVPGAEGRLQV